MTKNSQSTLPDVIVVRLLATASQNEKGDLSNAWKNSTAIYSMVKRKPLTKFLLSQKKKQKTRMHFSKMPTLAYIRTGSEILYMSGSGAGGGQLYAEVHVSQVRTCPG